MVSSGEGATGSLDAARILANARAMGPAIAARSEKIDELRRLPADLVAALAAHVAGRSPSSPLFTTTTGTRLDNSNLLRRVRAAADGLGLPPLRVHDLRHTGISLALSIGVPVADVAKWCGHANAAVTLSVYAGAVPGRESVVADAFAAHSSGVVVPLRSVAS